MSFHISNTQTLSVFPERQCAPDLTNPGVADSTLLGGQRGKITGEQHENQQTGQFMLIITMWEWGPRMATPLDFPSFKSEWFSITSCFYMRFHFFQSPHGCSTTCLGGAGAAGAQVYSDLPTSTEAIPLSVSSQTPLHVHFCQGERTEHTPQE